MNGAPETPVVKPAFTSEDLGAGYRPIPALAVLSFILGVLSLVAFVSGPMAPTEPLLAPIASPGWYLAPIAALLAWRTSRWLDAARVEFSGQLIAKIGLFCAVLALVCAPLRYYTKRMLLARESKVEADLFIDALLEHRLDDAYKQMAPAYQRDLPLEELVDKLGRAAYERFHGQSTVAALQGRGMDTKVHYLGAIYGDTQNGVDSVIHQYVMTFWEKDGRKSAHGCQIALDGAISPDQKWEGRGWTVSQQSYVMPVDPAREAQFLKED